MPSEGPGALVATSKYLLVPEGTPRELDGVFQLPMVS